MADDKEKQLSKDEPGSLSEPSSIIEPQSTQLEDKVENDAGAQSQPEHDTKQRRGVKKFFHFGNKYILIFGLLLLLAIGGVFAAIKITGEGDQESPTAQSLTDQQIAELRGSTTIVGDSEQILDIQSDSIFEGKVLIRNSLDVAGSVKIGGPLSLPAVTVGGSTSLGQVQVNSTLSVAGNTILQGPVTLRNNLSVGGSASISGTLSVSTLNVTNLQLAGDLSITRHINPSGGVPGKTNGSALGSGGTASVSGTDTAGTINIKVGSSPSSGTLVAIKFTQSFNSTPHVVVTPVGSGGASLSYYVTRTTTGFNLATASAPSGGANFSFDYIVID